MIRTENNVEKATWFLNNADKHIRTEYLSPDFWDFMQWGIQHDVFEVRKSAAKAFVMIASKTTTESASILISLLEKPLTQIKEYSLEPQEQKEIDLLNSEAIPGFWGILVKSKANEKRKLKIDKDWEIRRYIIEAVRQATPHADSLTITRIFALLQTAKNDENQYVCAHISYALVKLLIHASKEFTPNIVSLLKAALSDKDFRVREAVVTVLADELSKMSNELFPVALSLLEIALTDEPGPHSKFQSELRLAVSALGNLGAYAGKEFESEIVNLYESALKNDTQFFKKCLSVADSFKEIKEHPIKEIIRPLVMSLLPKILNHEESVVRSLGVFALINMASPINKESNSTIIQLLLKTAKDSDKDIVKHSIRFLGDMAVYASPEEILMIIDTFQNAVSDPEGKWKALALETLGRITSYVKRESALEIINFIATMLIDEKQKIMLPAYVEIDGTSFLKYRESRELKEKADIERAIKKEILSAAIHVLVDIAGNFPKDKELISIVTRLITKTTEEREDSHNFIVTAMSKFVCYADQKMILTFVGLLQKAINESRDPSLQSKAIETFGKIVRYLDEESILSIINCVQPALKGADKTEVRYSAAKTYGEIAPFAKKFIPSMIDSLKEILSDKEEFVRTAVITALKLISANADKNSVVAITELFLQTIGYKTVLNTFLGQAIPSDSVYVRADIVSEITGIAAYANEEALAVIFKVLQEASTDKDQYVRECAGEAYNAIDINLLKSMYLSQKESIKPFKSVLHAYFMGQCIPIS